MARPWGTTDAETDPFQHGRIPKDFLWGAYTAKDGFLYWWNDRDGYLEWLKGWGGVIYAHNAGRFDSHLLVEHFNTAKPIKIMNGRIASVYVGETEIRDSWLLCPTALEAYRKQTIDYAIMEADVREQHRAEIIAYMEVDCVALHELLEAFFSLHPGRPLTLPTAGMRSMAKLQGIKPPYGNAGFDEQFRPWYFGGRCEAFVKGEKATSFAMADINSAYPYVMRNPHPWGFSVHATKRLPGHPKNLRRSFAEITARSHGALPLRTDSGRIEYPCDDQPRVFRASGWEIEAGLETGTLDVLRVHQCHVWQDALSFAPYVDDCFAARQAAKERGDAAGEYVQKIRANGVYGKFAQDPTHFCDWYFLEPDDPDVELDGACPSCLAEPCRCELYEFGPHRVRGVPTTKGRWYNVATAASITGAVRAILWRAICKSKNPIYCDTDSLAAGSLNVEYGSGLGLWKHEGYFAYYAIGGRKLYAFGMDGSPPSCTTPHSFSGETRSCQKCGSWKIASKGCSLTPREIARIARGATVTWENHAPTFRIGKPPMFIRRKIKAT